MKTAHEILEQVGRERACAALGVGRGALRMALQRNDGKMPAAWLDELEKLAGEPLPREAFAWKRSSQPAVAS